MKWIVLSFVVLVVLSGCLGGGKLNPNVPISIPDSMLACTSDSECIMAGAGAGPTYGSLICGCVNEEYKDEFEGECNSQVKCPCENYCKCVNNKCGLEIASSIAMR